MFKWFRQFLPQSGKKSASARQKKQARYRSFQLSKKLKSQAPKPASVRVIASRSLSFCRRHKRRLGLHVLVFLCLYGLLVYGFAQQFDLTSLKASLTGSTGKGFGAHLATGIELVNKLLLETSQGLSEQFQVFAVLLVIIFALVGLWLIRSLRDGPERPKLKDAYYFGPAQFVPFVLVLAVVALQFLPMLFANQVAESLRLNEVLLTTAEQVLVVVLVILFNIFSIYMVTGTVFGLIVVSLSGARPWQSLQSSLNLTRHRRWLVIRHTFGLVLISSVLLIGLMLPIVLLATVIAEYLLYLIYVCLFVFWQIYLYELYRELMQ